MTRTDDRAFWPFHLACALIFSLPGALLCLMLRSLFPVAALGTASTESVGGLLVLAGASLLFGILTTLLFDAQRRRAGRARRHPPGLFSAAARPRLSGVQGSLPRVQAPARRRA